MFKLESYITPILLSYVDKYIKNFRLEDSQVSLWGGDATFHNLDLRLEVLEQELHLPFSFVSGHIRELAIHVPWTKITSEPITITINTIECILKLRGSDSVNAARPERQKKFTKPETEAPPGYVQQLINKIVSNIRICCNNLILKYVEEDIVLSMNVKLLQFESANEKWEPAYTDLSPAQVILRKIITVNDLTLCLDKRNAAGKIDVYQEPMLYRCSMTMHLLRHYHSATANRASTTRLDIYCNKMEFGMTEQQVPMLMRIIMLLYALQQKQLRPSRVELSSGPNTQQETRDTVDENETWTGWAWSYVSSVYTYHGTDEFDDDFDAQSGHTMHMGFYVDHMSITFKLSETSSDHGYYAPKKLRYRPMLTLQLQGIYSESVMHGLKWLNSSCGIGQALLFPVGACSCSHEETADDQTGQCYLSLGAPTSLHKVDSLFDEEAIENQGKRRQYNTSWEHHLAVNTESSMLERTSAIAFDYIYQLEMPDDMTSESLYDLGSNYEFSNLSEMSDLRICFGPFKLRLCSGLFHRVNSLQVAASYYDYAPYSTPKVDLPLSDLLPPSEDDYDALCEFIPQRATRVTFFAPVIELQLMDHPYFEADKGHLYKKRKKLSNTQYAQRNNLPRITIECQFFDISIQYPMYVNRLVHTTCQLPDLPARLFNACYSEQNVKLIGLTSRLICNQSSTIILIPCNMSYTSKSILKPQYWINPDIPHNEIVFESESITVNGTKAKMMLVAHILEKMLQSQPDSGVNSVYNTSLLTDATRTCGLPYLELCIESVRFKKVTTNSTACIDLSLGSIKAFIFEPIAVNNSHKMEDMQQVLFISGPEPTKTDNKSVEDMPLFTATMQYPLVPEVQMHPPILVFNLQEIRICIDPLLCMWLLYMPVKVANKPDIYVDSIYYRNKTISEASGSAMETPRRLSTQIESVHSSSDRDLLHLPLKQPKTSNSAVDLQEKIYNVLKTWFDVWKGMLLCGDVSQCTIYFPMQSLSAVGSQGIQQAVEQSIKKESPCDIMVITLPFANIRSAQRHNISSQLIERLPIKLSDSIWSKDKSSFPWSMSISDLSCYTIQYGHKLIFLKGVSLSATVGLATRPLNSESIDSPTTSRTDLGHLGVCVHIDMSPVVVSTSEIQVCLFASILYGLMEVMGNLLPDKRKQIVKVPSDVPLNKHSSTLSPTILLESTLETNSDQTVPAPFGDMKNLDTDSVKLTAWVQWTITRFTVELLSSDSKSSLESGSVNVNPRLKLVIDAEDIVSSLDFQNVYLKIKNKIGSVSIQHYKRNTSTSKWKPGPFCGIVMRLREDIATRHEDNGFLSVTLTRASCKHTHTLWGTVQKRQQMKKIDAADLAHQNQSQYISEIVVNVQPMDFLVSMKTLNHFYMVVVPLLKIPQPKERVYDEHNLWTNQNLPLAYLDCQDIRVIVPSSELCGKSTIHDVCLFQIEKISLNPSAVNPICRTPVRPDIYEQAAQARILNIPGSEVEDRQYQIDLIGLSISTSTWKDLSTIFSNSTDSNTSILRSMSENPALEWNNLEKGQPNMTPSLNLWQICDKFDISIVAAPAMIYKENTPICGNSIEINFVTDIKINLSLNQIKLASSLLAEFSLLIEPFVTDENILCRAKITFPYSQYVPKMSDESVQLYSSDIIRDSGIDTSDIKSVLSLKSQFVPQLNRTISDSEKQYNCPRSLALTSISIPFEILLTGGGIFLSLYQVDTANAVYSKHKNKKNKKKKQAKCDLGYDASEESVEEKTDNYNNYEPLIYVSIIQPNAYLSKHNLTRRFQLSCFDVKLKLYGSEYSAINHIPTEDDYPVRFLETRSGVPHPSTGILPAFFTIRYTKGMGKSATLDVDISKPTKILCSPNRWLYLQAVGERVLESFRYSEKAEKLLFKHETEPISPNAKFPDTTYRKFQEIKDHLNGINTVNLSMDQIIFAVTNENGYEVELGVKQFENTLNLNSRPEKLCNSSTFHCITLTIVNGENNRRLFLNPWTISVEVGLFWEAWQSFNSEPQIHLTAESDCILLDISSESVHCFEVMIREFKEILSTFPTKQQNRYIQTKIDEIITDKDQHYKDDLRAGAFQFVDANTTNVDELPLPYQVIFWNKTAITAMAWRYPQPRALTKVRIFPVPYKMTLSTESEDDLQVLCHLEYWSECRNCYLPFTNFFLSESEVCHLNLPNGDPQPTVASIWRVLITIQSNNDDVQSAAISPRALAACMRIDSYFNKSLIPHLSAALYVTRIDVSLFSHLSKTNSKLPKCLEKYQSDGCYPENQCFLTLTFDNLSVHSNIWNAVMFTTQLSSSFKCSALDYTFLTVHPLVEPFTFKCDLISSNHLTCNMISKPIELLFSTNVAHTLTVSSQLCMQNFSKTETKPDFIITTKYVICNDSNASVRFGQVETDEEIILLSKQFHLYAWRTQKRRQRLKIALENEWSSNFGIEEDGVRTVHFSDDVTVYIIVKSLSITQKQVIISGRLTICNMLLEHFEFKVVEIVDENKDAAFKQAITYVTSSKTATPSIFLKDNKAYHLRLRFYGLESTWTGDIPLKEQANGSQPWLVKVPLQERGQFLSIWCRIVVQEVNDVKRVMAMLWPLFTIRSHLPISSKIHIHTQILNVHLDCMVNGKGAIQQLYCPGTIDHTHQLSYDMENVKSSSNYVPLNYNCVDQQEFFKRLDNESIDEILTVLETYDDVKWPYFGDELDDVEWIVEGQPLTHVMIRYQKACQYSSSLLIELFPWCLMVNTLGTAVTVLSNGLELCRIQHHGIVAPPKLEANFNLAVSNGGKLSSSGPLQLAKSDWSQTFYMPKITGTIPLDGNIKTFIICENHICMVSIMSSVVNEMKLLKISSTHVLSNHMGMQMQVVCLAVSDNELIYDLPKHIESFSFTLPPHLHKTNSGIPIIKWLQLDKNTESGSTDFALYVLFSIRPHLGWSCPIRVDKAVLRSSFSVNTEETSIPVVLTSHEHKGQIYLSIHNDPKPQIYIENKSEIDLFCGQTLGAEDKNIVTESKHFKWHCKIKADSSKYYSMPLQMEKFPDLPNQNMPEMIVFASDASTGDDKNELHWSTAINLTSDHEQFIRIPFVGDVKLKVTNASCITIVKIESVSKVEISARDIRVRLSMHELRSNTSTSTASSSSYKTIQEEQSSTVVNTRRKSKIIERKSLIVNTIPLICDWKSAKINVFLKSFVIKFTNNVERNSSDQFELANFVVDNIALSAIQTECLTVKFSSSAVQFDNQLYSNESYDFPVLLIGQNVKASGKLNSLNTPIYDLINDVYENALITFEFTFDTFDDCTEGRKFTGAKYVKITLNPISCFIEDVYITRLMDYLNNFIPTKLVLWPTRRRIYLSGIYTNSVIVPEIVSWQCAILAKPLTCRNVIVNPISLLLSVHCSIKLYIALDQSPLQFGKFERKRLQTTPYRLGHAMTMHYLSGAIFRAGWVVSSLELLGSPGGLARAMGSGLRDFVSLPYRGLVLGPMAFLKGITHGSASLMRHVTAGTLQSVTKLASSVARNLDRLTLDEEHLKRTEEQRRQRPQGLAQGFMQGLTGLGISLLGAVGGIAHHPLQSMMNDGASPRSFATGVGLGLVGVVTKPLSGAAELVALTGQGLLQGAGWNSLPEPRSTPVLHHVYSSCNSVMKYNWKLIHWFSQNCALLYVTEATYQKSGMEYEAVALVLTTEALIVLSLDDDRMKRIDDIAVLNVIPNNDPTLLSFKVSERDDVVQVKTEDELVIEMDPDCRARVADYVRNTVGLLNITENTDHSEISISPLSSPSHSVRPKEEQATVLSYYVSPQNRNYFICLLALVKQQKENYNFSVL